MTDAIPAKAGTIGRRAGELLLTIGIILSGLPLAAFADGGTLRLSETKRPYRISVLTSPNPFRAGPVDISVIVADAATGDVLPDVKVDLHLAPARSRPTCDNIKQSAETRRTSCFSPPTSSCRGPVCGASKSTSRDRREPLKRASGSRPQTGYPAGSACGPGSAGRFSSSASSPFIRHFPLVGFPVGPGPNVAALIHLDMNEVRMTADGAVLGVFLARPGRQIDRHDDFLAARSANVAGFFLHDGRFFDAVLPGSPDVADYEPLLRLAE